MILIHHVEISIKNKFQKLIDYGYLIIIKKKNSKNLYIFFFLILNNFFILNKKYFYGLSKSNYFETIKPVTLFDEGVLFLLPIPYH